MLILCCLNYLPDGFDYQLWLLDMDFVAAFFSDDEPFLL